MFDLEKSIQAWKRSFQKQETFEDGTIADLEAHLRDIIDVLKREGMAEDEAFREAVARIGEAESLAAECGKVREYRLDLRRPWRPSRFMPALLGNYLKVALRSLKRHKGYAFMNIAGLAAALTCVLLILLYVRHELSYDRYHPDARRIYRVVGRSSNEGLGDPAFSPHALAPAVLSEFPNVQSAARIMEQAGWVRPSGKETAFYESRFYFADANIFDVLSIPLIAGDPLQVLARPRAVIVSASTAAKYWGSADPIGQTIVLADDSLSSGGTSGIDSAYSVTGVFRDFPAPTHLHADLIGSAMSLPSLRTPDWNAWGSYTYLKTRPGADPAELQARIQEMYQKNQSREYARIFGEERARSYRPFGLLLQPITSIHLGSHLVGEAEPNGDQATIAVCSTIALLILIVAGANFVNLATARAGRRAREVGIRKVVGASRSRLVRQFLIESSLMTFIAFSLAYGSAATLLPYFRGLSGRDLRLEALADPGYLAWLLAGFLLYSLLAGIYPAFFLSSPRPQALLKGTSRLGRRGRRLRAGLVVFQFAVVEVLTIGTLMIAKQMRYVRTADLGFKKNQVLLIHHAELLGSGIEPFKGALNGDPRVASMTVAGNLPVPSASFADAIRLDGQADASQSYTVNAFYVDEDYIPTLGLDLVQGREFAKRTPAERFSVIINEAMARRFGWTTPLGMRFRKNISEQHGVQDWRWFTVIGVVRDFNYQSVRREIRPAAFFLGSGSFGNEFVAARLKTGDPGSVIENIHRTWTRLAPGWPFEYSFLDERFDSMYKAERTSGRILAGFTVLAVLISCLGLFGLAAFTAEQRTKEIGVRKVLGASIRESVWLLTKEFAVLVGLACLLAGPIAFFLAGKWLEGFAYRTRLGVDIFLAAGAISLVVAVLTVAGQALKAALANPVDSLRYE